MPKAKEFNHRVTIRLSDKEYCILDKIRKINDLTMSETLRRILIYHYKGVIKGKKAV